MSYEVKLSKFQGPLEKLLELIEDKKLQINEISLAVVTTDFLKYLEESKPDYGVLADFISIASRLILVKSKSLLPGMELTEEEEGDIKDLAHRLELYKEFKVARGHFEMLWKSKATSRSRVYMGTLDSVRVFYPGSRVTKDSLLESVQRIFESLEKISKETETIKDKIVTLEEKIKEVIGRVKDLGETSLNKLSETKNKAEIVVIFLAILHLAREQLIHLEQDGHFSDIMIKHQESQQVN